MRYFIKKRWGYLSEHTPIEIATILMHQLMLTAMVKTIAHFQDLTGCALHFHPWHSRPIFLCSTHWKQLLINSNPIHLGFHDRDNHPFSAQDFWRCVSKFLAILLACILPTPTLSYPRGSGVKLWKCSTRKVTPSITPLCSLFLSPSPLSCTSFYFVPRQWSRQ